MKKDKLDKIIRARTLDEYFSTSSANSPQSQNADGVPERPSSKFKPKKPGKDDLVQGKLVDTARPKVTATGEPVDQIVINPTEKNNKNIREAKERHGVMIFGRFNPPHTGHEQTVNHLKALAKKHGTKANIFVSHSHDAKRNPIDPKNKTELIRHAFGDNNTDIHVSSKEEPSPVHAAKKMYQAGFDHLHVVAGEDRVEELKSALEKMNNKPLKDGSEPMYSFKSINVHAPRARTDKEMSGTKMRQFAKKGNEEEFQKNLPTKLRGRHKEVLQLMQQPIKEALEEGKKQKLQLIKRNLVAKDLNTSGLYKPKVETSKKDFKRVKIKKWNLHKFDEALDVKTPSPEALAKKYKMSSREVDKLVDQGSKIEKEHTKSKETAKEIARDHIGEKPDYYKKLKKYVEGVSLAAHKKVDVPAVLLIAKKAKEDKIKRERAANQKHVPSSVYIGDRMKEETVEEGTHVLTPGQRRDRSLRMRKNKVKLQRFRKIARNRPADAANLQRKSLRYAKAALRKRLAGPGGTKYSKAKMGDKIAIDRFIDKKVRTVHTYAARMKPKVRQAEIQRLQRVKSRRGARGTLPYFKGQHMLTMSNVPDGELFLEAFNAAAWEPNDNTLTSLEQKALDHNLDFDIVFEVYQRGIDDYETQALSPEQFAMNRVNSFCAGGRALLMDADLLELAPLVAAAATGAASGAAAEVGTRVVKKVLDKKKGNTNAK